jgi:hypothetical protein
MIPEERTRCTAWPQGGYLNKAKKMTHVINAKPINNVLWPHRATIPSMFVS